MLFPAPAAVRTVVVGIDSAGRLVLHDRSAADVLGARCRPGVFLGDLLAPAGRPALAGLLDSLRRGQEATAPLTLRTRGGGEVGVSASVTPAQGGGALAALVSLGLPAGGDLRADPDGPSREPRADAILGPGATLDLDQLAHSVINSLVPHFCDAAGLLLLESLVAADEPPDAGPPGAGALRRVGFATRDPDPRWAAAFPTGEVVRHLPGTPFARCMDTGRTVLVDRMPAGDAAAIADSGLHGPVGDLMAGASLLLLPISTPEGAIGLISCVRRPGAHAFDGGEAESALAFAGRAAVHIDNARRYARERATALTLQRSLLPIHLSAPSSVQIAHRYLPGSQLVEVGGDWYESIALPGGRVALAVGDVAGQGVRAAVTMGRLRTALQTLAMLELPPAESLQQLDELMQTMLGTREPHFATCAYAIYDAASGMCEVALAGHPPPLLVRPDGRRQFLNVPVSPPLGVGHGLISSRTFAVEDGSTLVLYTDGLVESRGRDIDDGLARLRASFGPGAASRPVDELCGAVLEGAYADHERDDIAVLVARLSRIADERQEGWVLPSDATSARRARALVEQPLERWNLAHLLPTTQLLVSELVTNAIRHADGPRTLRLIQEGGLVCEVHDRSAALPRLRHAERDDERGRGLQIVSQLSHRWGARRIAAGKVVWCEQPALPAPG